MIGSLYPGMTVVLAWFILKEQVSRLADGWHRAGIDGDCDDFGLIPIRLFRKRDGERITKSPWTTSLHRFLRLWCKITIVLFVLLLR